MVFTESAPSRPDIVAGRGAMFRESGVETGNGFARVDEESRNLQPMSQQPLPAPISTQTTRPEMRGPQNTDIDNILAGLKTRNVDIHEKSDQVKTINTEDDSMISISSLKDLQNGNMPKRSNRRRNGSARNTISLDI
jgi:hypothetical protein